MLCAAARTVGGSRIWAIPKVKSVVGISILYPEGRMSEKTAVDFAVGWEWLGWVKTDICIRFLR
jgi:hypothetical protein